MRARTVMIFGAVVLALSAQSAAAKPLNNAGITRGEMAAFLKAKGYPVTAAKDDNGLSILKSTAVGVNFDVYFFDCNKAERCQAMQFAAGWTMSTPVKLEMLNKWNRDNRYMRAYVQEGGALYGELDMVVAPGGSTDQIEAYRKHWERVLGNFKTAFGL